MNAPHLLVWFDLGELRASELSRVPSSLVYKGETFYPEAEYFGDVDYLRDTRRRLVGFGYISGGKQEKAIWSRLLSQSKNVRLAGGMLVIKFQPCTYEVKSVQAMGTEVYRSTTGEVILAIPNWGVGELAFTPGADDGPWPEYSSES